MDESYFKTRYEADAANRAKQSWTDHLGWVKTFYEGKRFPPIPGWNDRERDILKRVPAAEAGAVRAALAETGRLLASEWAKDNSVRKVSTDDLRRWGGEFGDAAKDPSSLLKALEAVRAEIARRAG
ncbi:MAG TPA: hypothetical protein VM889_04830 [Candidatus Thermoplasmatota archaeon]|nr:hypothetical protein [Candidatus Thermoplasmatota archaeon]